MQVLGSVLSCVPVTLTFPRHATLGAFKIKFRAECNV